eukprot:10906_6
MNLRVPCSIYTISAKETGLLVCLSTSITFPLLVDFAEPLATGICIGVPLYSNCICVGAITSSIGNPLIAYALLAMSFKSSVAVLSIWRNEHGKDNTCLYTSTLPSNAGFRYWITASGGTSSARLKALCSFRVRSFAFNKSSTIFAIRSVVFEDSKFCLS